MRHFCVFRAQETCLLAANVVPVSVERYLKIEANVVVSERTVCYRVVVYPRDYFLYIHFYSP